MDVMGKRKMVEEDLEIKRKKKARLEESGGLYNALLLQANKFIRSMTTKSQITSSFALKPHCREDAPKLVATPKAHEFPANVIDLLGKLVSIIRSMAFESQWRNPGVELEEGHCVALISQLEGITRLMLLESQSNGQQLHKHHTSVLSKLDFLPLLVETLIHSMTPKSQCSNLNPQLLTPEIILYEILPWLPLESLFRFKLVCKEWNKAISTDSVLRDTQCRRSMHHPPGLMYRGLRENTIFLDPYLRCTVMNYMRLKGSSNGLLCCSFRRQGSKFFLVMNPLIRQAVGVHNSGRFRNVTIAFEPSGCPPYFALVGWEIINKEYVVNGEDVNTVGFNIYTTETRRWSVAKANVRIVRESLGQVWGKSQGRTVYVGGKVYWKIVKDVFWFDINEDSAGTVTVPNMEGSERPQGEIGGLNGELSYSTMSDDDIHMVVWVLHNREKKWAQKYCVLLTDIFKGISDNTPSCCKNAVLQIFEAPTYYTHRALPYEGGDLLIWAAHGTLSRQQGVVFSYNMETRSLRIIHDSQMIRWGITLFSYKRSLASVPKETE